MCLCPCKVFFLCAGFLKFYIVGGFDVQVEGYYKQLEKRIQHLERTAGASAPSPAHAVSFFIYISLFDVLEGFFGVLSMSKCIFLQSLMY